MRTRTMFTLIGTALAAMSLAACGNTDPLADGNTGATGSSGASDATTATAGDGTIVIGSQDYYSNEIIAEIYAQALEADGLKVDRQFRIGQREAYMDEIESGKIDLFPEYTGPLLRYWKPDSTETMADDVYSALKAATPQGLKVLDMSAAADQDSYVVTKPFADRYGVKALSDLSKVTEPITVGANSEAETRPYGPAGLKEKFGLDVKFTPIEDGGGPLTIKALKDNTVQMAVIYTASPQLLQANPENTSIPAKPDSEKLVVLDDDKGLFTASNVVPLGSTDLPESAMATINAISATMNTEHLIMLNDESVTGQKPAKDIAKEWLEVHKDLKAGTPEASES